MDRVVSQPSCSPLAESVSTDSTASNEDEEEGQAIWFSTREETLGELNDAAGVDGKADVFVILQCTGERRRYLYDREDRKVETDLRIATVVHMSYEMLPNHIRLLPSRIERPISKTSNDDSSLISLTKPASMEV